MGAVFYTQRSKTRVNDKIKNSRTRTKLHKKITDIEGEISKDRESDKLEIERIHIMVEKLSRLKTMAKEELLRQQDTLSLRQGYKRVHYQTLLSLLQNGDFTKAREGYENLVKSYINQRKVDLAEIDLAVITTILFKTREKEKLIPLKRKFSKSRGFVSEIIDFIITLIEYPDQSIHLQAIKLFENLALFREEKAILHQLVKLTSVQIDEQPTDATLLNNAVIQKNIEKLSVKEKHLPKRKMLERKYWREAINSIKSQNYSDAARQYISKMELLVQNDHSEFFPVSLVMGIICLMKVGKSQEAKREIEKATMSINLPQDILQSLAEIKLLELLLMAHQVQDEEKSDIVLESFIDYLPLLPVESGLILNLISPSKRTEIKADQFADYQIVAESTVLQNQQLSNLNRRASEERERLEESFRKRNALKRIVYKNTLALVAAENYEEASLAYFNTAIKQTTKRDYTTASVLILLGSLCILKNSVQISQIGSFLDNFMQKIGFSEKVVSETFSVKIIKLLIDAKSIGNAAMFNSAWNLLQNIPVFEEEKILFEI